MRAHIIKDQDFSFVIFTKIGNQIKRKTISVKKESLR